MPTAFQNAYARFGSPEQYVSGGALPALKTTVGNDFQAHYHAQKKADADRMVRAKVDATTMMYKRSNSSAHGFFGMPKPVLGQRKFANPSAGALSGTSAREDYGDAPFHFSDAHGVSGAGSCGRLVGGVLRSAQGQSYGVALLQKRIAEFDNIAQLSAEYKGQTGFVNGMEAQTGELGADITPLRNFSQRGQTSTFVGQPSTFVGQLPQSSQQLGLIPLVELSQLLQSILNALSDGEAEASASRLTYQDSVRAFALIVRLATTAGAEDIDDVIEFIDGGSSGDGILPKLGELTIRPVTDAPVKNQQLYLSLKEFWERVKVYLDNMAKTVGMPYKNRQSASQAYIKTLRFTKIFRGKLPEEFVVAEDAQQAMDDRSNSEFSRGTPFADDDRSGPSGYAFTSSSSSSSGRGGRPVVRREDSQHGYRGDGGQEFSYDDRQRFAYASGEFPTGGRPVGFSGEEAQEYDEAPPTFPEEEDGEEEFDEDATGTNPSNAGPRLVSRRDETTGEYDVVAPKAERRVFKIKKTPASEPAPASAPASKPLPPFLKSRSDLAGLTNAEFQALAKKVNTYYGSNLPDGKGQISVSAYSKPRSIRTNFIKRLGIPAFS
jgi:hypothetical protein